MSSTTTCLFLDGDSVGSGNDDGRAHVAEESVVDNTANSLDVFGHLSGILDWFFKVKIDNVVSVVGDSDFVSIVLVVGGGSHSEDGLASLARRKGSNFPHGVLVAEGGDFDGDGESRSQAVAQLGLVNCKRSEDLFVCLLFTNRNIGTMSEKSIFCGKIHFLYRKRSQTTFGIH